MHNFDLKCRPAKGVHIIHVNKIFRTIGRSGV